MCSTDMLETMARQVRSTCVQMAFDAGESHLSSALSCVDLLVCVFAGWLRGAPGAASRHDRDYFILSKGHGCTALYAAFAVHGYLPADELATYGRAGSRLQSHPCAHALPLLEVSTGSLGHGLGIASGIACGLALRQVDRRAVALLSDGDCNEGSTWEAAMFAAARSLDGLVAIVDHNGRQAVGTTRELMGETRLEQKFVSFGWASRVIDGHDIGAILEALSAVPFEKGRPSVIIAHTRAGAGIRFMEDNQVWFYRRPDATDLRQALLELGAPPLYEGKRG